jgi:hypothetical protein
MITQALSVDIGHVTQWDLTLLNADAERTQLDPVNTISNGGCLVVWRSPNGYVLHVDEPDTDDGTYTELFAAAIAHGYSEDLVHLMRVAQKHQCIELTLERDGRTFDDLPRPSPRGI